MVIISAINGMAGIGKTTLALRWAHQVADQFPDGQLYVNLRGFDPAGSPVHPAEAIRGFLDALGVEPRRIPVELNAQAALYRSLVAGRRFLVLLDNARDAEQVRPLLPGTETCLVLVTSRGQLSSLVAQEGAHPLSLDLLSVTEARELLARHLGPDRASREPGAVDELIELCAQLPLALSVVASRAAARPKFPLAELADELRDAQGRLDALDAGDLGTNVRAVFSWSYRHLDESAAWMFRVLGVHPGPDISAPAAASLAATPLTQARKILGELTRIHLVTERVPGRFAFHDLLRAYAAELARTLNTGGERHAAVHRMLDHYLHTAFTADRLLYPHRDPETAVPAALPGVAPEHLTSYGQAQAWFEAEHPVLLAAIAQAADTGFSIHACQIPWTLATFFEWRGHWRDFSATQATALTAARRLGDRDAQARAHSGLARASARLGAYDDARRHTQLALDLYQQLGDRAGQAYIHRGFTLLCEQQGRQDEALAHARQALALSRAVGHKAAQAKALNNLGWQHARHGDHQQALSYCQRALTIQQESGDRYGEAETWDSLGYTHHHLGHFPQATTCYRQSLALRQETSDRYLEAVTLTHLGDTYHAAGDMKNALSIWQRAVTILNNLHHPEAAQVRAKLHDIGEVAARQPQRETIR